MPFLFDPGLNRKMITLRDVRKGLHIICFCNYNGSLEFSLVLGGKQRVIKLVVSTDHFAAFVNTWVYTGL